MLIRIFTGFAIFACSSLSTFSPPLKITSVDGGSVVTALVSGIKLNEKSTLKRTWIILNDPKSPVQLDGSGITTKYFDRDYKYEATGTLVASEPIVALNVRFLLYDVFGQHIKTLGGEEVRDVPANTPFQLKYIGSWRAWENEVSELLTVVSFVAQIRTASGKIWRYDNRGIEDELSKIQFKVTTGDLEPSKEK